MLLTCILFIHFHICIFSYFNVCIIIVHTFFVFVYIKDFPVSLELQNKSLRVEVLEMSVFFLHYEKVLMLQMEGQKNN